MTIFYVKTGGNDAAAGTSDAAAWATIAKVNSVAFNAGDRILFRAGDTFTDAVLVCDRTGAAGTANTILYGSYGSGGTGKARLAIGSLVWFTNGASFNRIENLILDSELTFNETIIATDAGADCHDNRIDNCELMNSNYGAININKGPLQTPGAGDDSGWVIDSCTFDNIGDNGMLVCGSDCMVANCSFNNTGWNDTLASGKHGIYAKCDRIIARNNTFTNIGMSETYGGSGISLRGAASEVYNNRYTANPSGSGTFASYFSQLLAGLGGTTFIYGNLCDSIDAFFFYFDSQGTIWSDFVVANNTSVNMVNGAMPLDVSAAAAGRASIILANNGMSMAAGHDPAFFVSWETPSGGKTLTEHYNAFRRDGGSSGSWYKWNGSNESYAAWQGHTGSANDDTSANDPQLDAGLVPQFGSPWIDVGTTTVAGITYVAG